MVHFHHGQTLQGALRRSVLGSLVTFGLKGQEIG